MDEFSLILIVITLFVVAAIGFIAGWGFNQSWSYDHSAKKHIDTGADEEDRAVLWKKIGGHIADGTLDSDEAQTKLDKVGKEGWFGRLASRRGGMPLS